VPRRSIDGELAPYTDVLAVDPCECKRVGYLILQAEGTFDINTVFAGILVLTAFALILDAAVGYVERCQLLWQPKASETEPV
jgi:hypothetical protein